MIGNEPTIVFLPSKVLALCLFYNLEIGIVSNIFGHAASRFCGHWCYCSWSHWLGCQATSSWAEPWEQCAKSGRNNTTMSDGNSSWQCWSLICSSHWRFSTLLSLCNRAMLPCFHDAITCFHAAMLLSCHCTMVPWIHAMASPTNWGGVQIGLARMRQLRQLRLDKHHL